MTPPSHAHDYGEDAAIEQPAIQLFASMGWETVNLYNEWASGKSSEGRQSEREIVLEVRLRSAIARLNPGLPPSAIDQVVEEVTLDRSRMIPVNANRELWALMRDGVKVRVNIPSFDVVGFADDELAAEERPFDPWRTPRTSKAETFVHKIIKMLEDHEALFGSRKRKRRAVDQLRFERMLSALACDLAVIVLTEGTKAIYISRSHQELGRSSRYGNPASSKTLPAILDCLASQQVDLISMTLGFRTDTGEGKKTTIRPSNKFRRLVRDHALCASDIAECERPEPIELKASPPSQYKKAQRIDYEDTAQTNRLPLFLLRFRLAAVPATRGERETPSLWGHHFTTQAVE